MIVKTSTTNDEGFGHFFESSADTSISSIVNLRGSGDQKWIQRKSNTLSYYQFITTKRGDSASLKLKMEETASQLIKRMNGLDPFTNQPAVDEAKRLELVEAPVAMVGQIQSGKTRAYLGVMAKCFDEGVDVAIILTKSSVVLGQQTVDRIKSDFSSCNCQRSPMGSRRLKVSMAIDLHKLVVPEGHRHILIAIKQEDHIKALAKILKSYIAKKDLKVLMIDDEADVTSINYDMDGKPEKVMKILSRLRRQFNGRGRSSSSLAMLQVTATPAALYLQRNHSSLKTDYITHQPDFTVLLDTHESYVGGSHYFDHLDQKDRVEGYLNQQLDVSCVTYLNEARSSHRIDSIVKGNRLHSLKSAFMTFITGVAIRSLQEERADEPFMPVYAGACLIHINETIETHRTQAEVTLAFLDLLEDHVKLEEPQFDLMIKESYQNLLRSLALKDHMIPTFEEVLDKAKSYFKTELDAQVVLVNSDRGENWHSDRRHHHLLHMSGFKEESILESPLTLQKSLNFFIGGNTFTRGVTIENLICSIYGRSTTRDADSALQHCRWYGARNEDLAVSRLYTTKQSFAILEEAYDIDTHIRSMIIDSGHRLEVLWNRISEYSLSYTSEQSRIHRPSDDTAVGKVQYWPKYFDLVDAEKLKELTLKMDDLVINAIEGTVDSISHRQEWSTDQQFIDQMCELIDQSLDFDRSERGAWHHEVAKAMFSVSSGQYQRKPKVIFLPDMEGEYDRANPTATERLSHSHSLLRDEQDWASRTKRPVMILTRQKGGESLGWGNKGPFYWPIFINPDFIKRYEFHHTDQGEHI